MLDAVLKTMNRTGVPDNEAYNRHMNAGYDVRGPSQPAGEDVSNMSYRRMSNKRSPEPVKKNVTQVPEAGVIIQANKKKMIAGLPIKMDALQMKNMTNSKRTK